MGEHVGEELKNVSFEPSSVLMDVIDGLRGVFFKKQVVQALDFLGKEFFMGGGVAGDPNQSHDPQDNTPAAQEVEEEDAF